MFPFSRNIAVFLFNTKCLNTKGDVDRIEIDDFFKNLVVSAEATIVSKFRKIAERLTNHHAIELFLGSPDRTFGERELQEWQLAREIDYMLWHFARHDGGSQFFDRNGTGDDAGGTGTEDHLTDNGPKSHANWYLDKNTVTRRRK